MFLSVKAKSVQNRLILNIIKAINDQIVSKNDLLVVKVIFETKRSKVVTFWYCRKLPLVIPLQLYHRLISIESCRYSFNVFFVVANSDDQYHVSISLMILNYLNMDLKQTSTSNTTRIIWQKHNPQNLDDIKRYWFYFILWFFITSVITSDKGYYRYS